MHVDVASGLPEIRRLQADTEGWHPCEHVGLAYIVCSRGLAYCGVIGGPKTLEKKSAPGLRSPVVGP